MDQRPQRPYPQHSPRLRADAQGCDDGLRQELAKELKEGPMDIRRVPLLVAVGAAVIAASFFLSLTIFTLLD
jgi:hypothetical protein